MQMLNKFKARPVDTKIMEKPNFALVQRQQSQDKQVPFSLQTDKRARMRTQSPSKSENNAEMQFKARPKPQYQFFEPKKSQAKDLDFNLFNLSTERRILERQKKEIVPEKKNTFVARKMPTFKEVELTSEQKTPKKLTKIEEFNLSTNQRGDGKSSAFKNKMQIEQFESQEKANFKATPVNAKFQ